MSYWVQTKGLSSIAIGVCDRCKRNFPLVDLFPDGNSPGLRVCIADRDSLDPYRLPARQTENITLPFVRPPVPLTFNQGQCVEGVLATETPEGVETEQVQGIRVDSIEDEEACDVLHYGVYGGKVRE